MNWIYTKSRELKDSTHYGGNDYWAFEVLSQAGNEETLEGNYGFQFRAQDCNTEKTWRHYLTTVDISGKKLSSM
jgi:hypothetical protein